MSVWVWDCEFEYLSKSISICACTNLFTIYYWTWSKALQSLEETSAIYICISMHQYTYSMNPGVKLALVEVSRANRAKWKDGQTLSTRYWETALLKQDMAMWCENLSVCNSVRVKLYKSYFVSMSMRVGSLVWLWLVRELSLNPWVCERVYEIVSI